jgi:hypothetical protein
MQHYAIYLDSRIRAYRDLKHDAVQVQSEQQRDMRIARGIDTDGPVGADLNAGSRRSRARASGEGISAAAASAVAESGLKRGKTLAGRKLRIMSVEKGLIRETKAVQKQIDTLIECKVGSQFTHSFDFGFEFEFHKLSLPLVVDSNLLSAILTWF